MGGCEAVKVGFATEIIIYGVALLQIVVGYQIIGH